MFLCYLENVRESLGAGNCAYESPIWEVTCELIAGNFDPVLLLQGQPNGPEVVIAHGLSWKVLSYSTIYHERVTQCRKTAMPSQDPLFRF